MKFKEICIVEVGANFISSALGVYWAIVGWGIWAYIWSCILLVLLSALGYMYFNRGSGLSLAGKFTKQEFKDLFSYGFGQTLNRLVHSYLNNSAGINFLVGKLLPMSNTGVFDRIWRIVMLPVTYLGKTIDRVMFAGTAKFNDDKILMYNTFKKSIKLSNIISFPIAFLLAVYAKEIVLILFGNNWNDAALILRILLISVPFGISQKQAFQFCAAKGLFTKVQPQALLILSVLYCLFYSAV